MSELREFRMRGPDKPYVAATARKILESDPYVYYDQVDDRMPYTAAQFAAIDAKVRKGFPEITRRFGAPSDLDANGRIVVFLGHAVAAEDPSSLAYVDPCNLGAPGDCGERGEIVYVRSLPDMGNAGRQDDYAMVQVPDAILHETIHLAWLAHGWRRFGHFAFRRIPRFFREGSAQLFAFSDEFEQEGTWKLVDRALGSRDSGKVGPFSSPYVLGGLLFHWLRQRHGDGVDQALLDDLVDYRVDDPVEDATGSPEPLAVATLVASLYFDGTPFGHETGLELPRDDVRQRLPHGVPAIAIGAGSSRRDASAYTGHVLYEINHTAAVRVELSTKSADKAYVVVAQP
jgi:hypothetical protein